LLNQYSEGILKQKIFYYGYQIFYYGYQIFYYGYQKRGAFIYSSIHRGHPKGCPKLNRNIHSSSSSLFIYKPAPCRCLVVFVSWHWWYCPRAFVSFRCSFGFVLFCLCLVPCLLF